MNYIKIVWSLRLTFNIKLKKNYFCAENQEISRAALQLLALFFVWFFCSIINALPALFKRPKFVNTL